MLWLLCCKGNRCQNHQDLIRMLCMVGVQSNSFDVWKHSYQIYTALDKHWRLISCSGTAHSGSMRFRIFVLMNSSGIRMKQWNRAGQSKNQSIIHFLSLFWLYSRAPLYSVWMWDQVTAVKELQWLWSTHQVSPYHSFSMLVLCWVCAHQDQGWDKKLKACLLKARRTVHSFHLPEYTWTQGRLWYSNGSPGMVQVKMGWFFQEPALQIFIALRNEKHCFMHWMSLDPLIQHLL